jgi:ankyrin repeat protein
MRVQFSIKIEMQDKEGNTPLHLAASNDQLESVRTLISFGANPDAVNQLGKRPIDYARSPEIMSILKGTQI